MPYIHIPPDTEIMQQLLTEIISKQIDAVVFTSTTQVRYLVNFARDQGVEKELMNAFATSIIALAVGKLTAQALSNQGFERVIFPELERIGSAIIELSNYYVGRV